MAKTPKAKSRSKSPAKKPARPGRQGRGRSRVSERSSEHAPIRAEGGRFVPGVSGNPGGRPKENDEVKAMARLHTQAAIERLVHWMHSENAKASVAACNALLDRAWGKASQPVTGADGGPVDVNLVEVRGGIASKLDRIATAIEKASVPR